MRLDVAGDNLLERVAVLSGLVPTPLVQISFGMGYARAIVAGVRLGVFEAIKPGAWIDAPELARLTGCHPVGIEVLANALVGFDLLKRKGGRYSLAAPARRWLRRDARMELVDAVDFLGYCLDLTANLENDVRTGDIVRLHDKEHSPEFWQAYMRALASFTKLGAPEVGFRLKRAGALKGVGGQLIERVLDVGGGHGRWAAALCDRVPGLRGEVLDKPEACAVGRQILPGVPGGDRVVHRDGDFREGSWGQGYDLILIFRVLHNATEDEAQGLMASAMEALRPGGWLAVLDAAHPGKPGGNVDASGGYNELFFFVISGARAWPDQTMRDWMTNAGFESLRSSRLLAAPEVLLLGQKPG
jgi:SAM-dependent methyltransferase